MKLFQQQTQKNAYFQRFRANMIPFLTANFFLVITVAQVINGVFQQWSHSIRQHQIKEKPKTKTPQQEEREHKAQFQKDMNKDSGSYGSEEVGDDFHLHKGGDDLFKPQNPVFVPAETVETQWDTEADSTDPFERARSRKF